METGGTGQTARTPVTRIGVPSTPPKCEPFVRTDIGNKLGKIRAEIRRAGKDGNGERVGDLEQERNRILAYVEENTDLSGRAREIRTEREETSESVGKAITEALKAIGKENKACQVYLEQNIEKGTSCRYYGDEVWTVVL